MNQKNQTKRDLVVGEMYLVMPEGSRSYHSMVYAGDINKDGGMAFIRSLSLPNGDGDKVTGLEILFNKGEGLEMQRDGGIVINSGKHRFYSEDALTNEDSLFDMLRKLKDMLEGDTK